MIFDQRLHRFLTPVSGDKPPWTFRNEEDKAELEHWGRNLEERRNTPPPIARYVVGAEAYTGRSNLTEEIGNTEK